MVQEVKAPATKSDNLSLIQDPQNVRIEYQKLPSDFHTHAVAHVGESIHKNVERNLSIC